MPDELGSLPHQDVHPAQHVLPVVARQAVGEDPFEQGPRRPEISGVELRGMGGSHVGHTLHGAGVRREGAQPPLSTSRSRIANPSGSSANPMWPPGNIVGSPPSAEASAIEVRSHS